MAATGANRSNRTTDHQRLPLTPKVTATRRGGPRVAGSAQRDESPATQAATPAMHITPNAVVVARGDVRGAGRTRGQRSSLLDARNLRRFAA